MRVSHSKPSGCKRLINKSWQVSSFGVTDASLSNAQVRSKVGVLLIMIKYREGGGIVRDYDMIAADVFISVVIINQFKGNKI